MFPGTKKNKASEPVTSSKEQAPVMQSFAEGTNRVVALVGEGEMVHEHRTVGDTALQAALTAFTSQFANPVSSAFVKLYLSSRHPNGDSPEAVAALDACRKAFDECGLVLADVTTKTNKSKAPVSKGAAQRDAKPTKSKTAKKPEKKAAKKSTAKSAKKGSKK